MIDINTIGVGVDTKEVKSAARDLDSFGKSADKASREADKLGNSSKKSESAISGLASTTKSFGIGIAAAGTGVIALGAALLDTSIKSEKLSNSLKFSTGSANAAAKEIEYLKKTTNELGLEFLSTSQSYAKFSAATKGTALEGQKTRDVFEAIAKASTVLGLSADESSGALLAISQMMSKGTVSAEELRGQLGERLPGAFQTAAKAMGVTTQELGKMLEQGQIVASEFLPKFAEELEKSLGDNPTSAAGSAQAQLNKLSNAWLEFKKSIAESGVITILVKLVEGSTGALDALNFTLFGKAKKGSIVDRADSFFTPLGGKVLNAFGIETAQQKSANAARRGAAAKNNLFGGIDFSSINYAPDFSAGVQAQDVDKIHKQQDALNKANQQSYDKQRDLAKKLYDEKIKEIQDEFTFEDEILYIQKKQKLEGEEELRKEKEKTQKAWLDLEQKNIEAAQKERDKAFEQEQRQLQKLADEQKEMAHEFSQALTNGLFDSFKKGESFGKAMLSNLLALAKTWAARLFDGLLSPIGSGIASIFTGGAASLFSGTASAASSGGGSIFSGLSSIGNLFSNGNAAIVSSIESLGTFLSTGTGGLGDMIGGALGQYAGQISNVLPFAGAALNLLSGNVNGAIGSALGAALTFTPLGPVGGIIGSFLGSALGGLFGGKSLADTKRSRVFVSASNEGGYKDLGYRQGGGNNLMSSAISPLQGLNQQFIGSLQILLNAFGAKDKLNLTSFFDVKNRATGQIFGDINGVKFTDAVQGGKKSAGQAQEIFDRFVEKVLGSTIVDAIKLTSLSSGVKKFFDGLTKKEDVLTAINTLASLNAALKDLPPVFDAIRNAIETTSYKTSIADLNTRFAAINTYTSLFYTQAEQFDTFTKQLTSQFDALGKTLPETREGFRALVDGITVTDKTTSDLFNGLVALAPAADAYYKQLLEQKGALQSLSTDLFSNASDYLYASALAGKGMNYTAQIGEIGTLNRAGDAGLNMVVQTLVNAQADTKALLEAVVKAVAETARLQKIWNGDGLPETRVI